MIQTSIFRYITSDSQHLAGLNSTSFLLRLPYDIRKRIYEYAGLYSGKSFNLNYDVPPWLADSVRTDLSFDDLAPPDDYAEDEEEEEVSEYSKRISRFLDGPVPNLSIKLQRRELYCCEDYEDEEDGACDCDFDPSSLPSQLLDVCRAISREVEHLFLSQNRFYVSSSDTGGFSGIFSLTPRGLGSLTSLTVNLNMCNCFIAGNTDMSACPVHRDDEPLCKPVHKSIFTSATFRHRSKMMVEWKKLCQNLAASITPHQLELVILCDSVDIKTAKQIVDHMLYLPILRSCVISFSMKPGTGELRELARNTALKLTGRSFAALDFPFRYLNLPREIQLSVLRHTDLVTPYDIAWCPDRAQITGWETGGVLQARSLVWDPSMPNNYWRKCCVICSPMLTMCCCSTKTSGHSTTCTWWVMPSTFFSVSRGFREDAIKTFYSENHFLVLPSLLPASVPPASYDQPSEILRFFTRFAARGTKFLRSITWLVPETNSPIAGTRALWELDRTIDICAEEGCLDRLSFVIDLTLHARKRQSLQESYHNVLPIAQMEENEWHSALLTVESMARYKG